MKSLLRRLTAVAAAVAALAAGIVGVLLASGQITIVATHGVSMNPVYYQGDLVVVARSSTYQIGDIVAYHVHGGSIIALHRIIGGDAAGFTVKGDNNQSTDIDRPTAAQIVGRAIVHVPQAGAVLKAIASPPVLVVAASALLGGGTTALTRHRRRRARRRTSMSRHLVPATRTRRRGLPAMLERPLRVWTATAAGAVVLSAALGAWAWPGPATAAGAGTSSPGEKISFSYTAPVRPSAAYDGTTASSPDPVFRRVLAGNVTVSYTYRGPAAAISVAAQLSTPGGWHTTIPLKDATSVSGNADTGTVDLDLQALEAKAQAAAQATGIAGTPITVTVVPTVRAAGSPDFAPALRFSLTPVQLSLADPASLTAQTPAASSAPAMGERSLRFGPWSLTTVLARPLSAGVFAAGLLALALIGAVARRRGPADEASEIRRRWGNLLVPVHPTPVPPGRAVVDVADFDTLAKLAERYGLLILHWSRSGVETFLVHDENTAYRYRTGHVAASAEKVGEEALTNP